MPSNSSCITSYFDDLSYAFSNRLNKMVHVDTVDNGLACDCICPHCKSTMVARQGYKNKHGFAHYGNVQSDKKACYMTALHRLAEQIISEEKRIMVSDYYGIFKSKQLFFEHVEIEKRGDRPDLQPDIVGITKSGDRYLIEIKNTNEVDKEKRRKIYTDSLTCIEIDVSRQRLENLKNFLIESSGNREWINNKYFFDAIESKYAENNKYVKVVSEKDCMICFLPCVQYGLKVLINKDKNTELRIIHNGKPYHLCKSKPGETYPGKKRVNIHKTVSTSHPKNTVLTSKIKQQATVSESENKITNRKPDGFIGSYVGYDDRFVLCPEDGTEYLFDTYEEALHVGDIFYKDVHFRTEIVKYVSRTPFNIHVIHKDPMRSLYYLTWIHMHEGVITHENIDEFITLEKAEDYLKSITA